MAPFQWRSGACTWGVQPKRRLPPAPSSQGAKLSRHASTRSAPFGEISWETSRRRPSLPSRSPCAECGHRE
eukprot:14558608-Alexandrium_andersonii.AAC.1